MNRDKRHAIFTTLRAGNPKPTTELHYTSPFELLVAVVLSAQATDKGVNKATDKLFPVANTPAAILDLGEAGLKGYIKTIGLFNSKAANIIKTCEILLNQPFAPCDKIPWELFGISMAGYNILACAFLAALSFWAAAGRPRRGPGRP